MRDTQSREPARTGEWTGKRDTRRTRVVTAMRAANRTTRDFAHSWVCAPALKVFGGRMHLMTMEAGACRLKLRGSVPPVVMGMGMWSKVK